MDMVYDTIRGEIVLADSPATTVSNPGPLETWTWNGAWLQRTSASSPTYRQAHVLAYDGARGVTVLFGGWGRPTQFLGDMDTPLAIHRRDEVHEGARKSGRFRVVVHCPSTLPVATLKYANRHRVPLRRYSNSVAHGQTHVTAQPLPSTFAGPRLREATNGLAAPKQWNAPTHST